MIKLEALVPATTFSDIVKKTDAMFVSRDKKVGCHLNGVDQIAVLFGKDVSGDEACEIARNVQATPTRFQQSYPASGEVELFIYADDGQDIEHPLLDSNATLVLIGRDE